MEKSKSVTAIQKRFGNSAVAKQAALAATKALASSGKMGKRNDAEPRVDELYKNARSELSQQSERGRRAGNEEHRPAAGALEAIAQPSMQPFLTNRTDLQLDDNKSYRMPEENNFDEQLFRGHLNSSATPPGHSEAPCTNLVHGGDYRFGARSPGHVQAAQMFSPRSAGSPDSKSSMIKQRSPSLAQRKQQVQKLKEEGASHALPPHRPYSPLPEDRQAIKSLAHSISLTSTADIQQVPVSAACPSPIRSSSPAFAAQHSLAAAGTSGVDATLGEVSEAGKDNVSTGCEQQQTVCSTAHNPDNNSPEHIMPVMCASSPVPGCGSAVTRPLSPLGRAIKSVPSELRHSAPPDMSKVPARYLESPDSEGRSRENSPNRRAAHQRHYLWRLGQMHADVPDYKSSQARMYENDHCLGTGSPQAVVTLKQVAWSFDGAHPALAGEHCMRTREQNESLQSEHLTAQRRIDEARRIADDQHRRAPARRAQLAAAARASADQALARSRGASASGHEAMNHRRTQSEGPATTSTRPRTAAALSLSGAHPTQEEVFRKLQDQTNSIAQRAEAVLARSEQLGQTVDPPLQSESDASARLRPQTAPTVRSEDPANFPTDDPELQRPMRPLSSGRGAVNDADSLCTDDVECEQQRTHDGTMSADAGPQCNLHNWDMSAADKYRDEAVATGVEVDNVQDGYESDLERDTVQQHQVAAEVAANMLSHSLQDEAPADDSADVFRNDNSWMDEYRKDVVSRCRSERMPEAGYFDEAVETWFQSPEPITTDLPENLTPKELALLQQRLIPEDVGLVANEAIARADRVTAARARARVREGYHSDDALGSKKQSAPIRSKSFGFEARARSRPKPIAQVKMEQDLEMKRRSEEKEATQTFKAKQVPRTSSKKSDGLYYKKQLQQSIAAKLRIDSRKQELSQMLSSGATFSFYEKDLEKKAEKARRLEAHRNNKNRFQVPFKAKEVPAHVKESRLVNMLEKQEQRKEQARAQAQQKLSAVNEEFERKQGRVAKAMTAAIQPFVGTVEDNIMYAKAPNSRSVHPLVIAASKAVGLHDTIMQLPKKYKTLLQEQGHTLGYHELNNAEMHLLGLARKNFEVRAKHSALRHTDTLWNKHSGRKPAGSVPDFDLLHAQWETRLSSAREQIRQHAATNPKDYSFNRGTPKEMAEREAREAERQQKVVLDQMLDEEELTELRWPFKSCRGKVEPTEPPVFLPVAYHETKASKLRRKHVQNCKEHGQYELRSVKEEQARLASKQELQRRARAHVAKQQADARQRILQHLQEHNIGSHQENHGGATASLESDADAELGEGDESDVNPEGQMATLDRLTEAHRKSRHNKIETDVTNMTRELLATAGVDVLRFVEGPQYPTQSAKQVMEAIVASVPRNKAEVGKQLSSHDDQVLKQCLREIGQEWNTSGGNARENAIAKLKSHIWNFMR